MMNLRRWHVPARSVLTCVVACGLMASCPTESPPATGSYESSVTYRAVAVTSMAFDPSEQLWVAAGGEIFRLDDSDTPGDPHDDQWIATVSGDDGPVGAATVFLDSDGGVWCLGWDGTAYLDDNSTGTDLSDDEWVHIGIETYDCIVQDASGALWMISHANPYGSGIVCLDPDDTPGDISDDTWTTFTSVDGLANDTTMDIAVDAMRGKWIATYFSGGVSHLDDGGTPSTKADDVWTTFSTTDGLAHGDTTAICIDSSGDKWFGTDGYGVSFLNDLGTPETKGGDVWVTFTEVDGLCDDRVRTMAEDTDGSFWIGTQSGLSRLDARGTPEIKGDDLWTSFTTANGLPYPNVTCIASRQGEGRWILCSDEGVSGGELLVFHDDNGTPGVAGDDEWVPIHPGDGLAGNAVRATAVVDQDRIWIGSGGWSATAGLSYLDIMGTPGEKADDRWVTFTTTDGLSGNRISDVAADSFGAVWVATSVGLDCLDVNGTPFDKSDDRWANYSTADGMASVSVTDIRPVSAGGVWVATNAGVHYLVGANTPTEKSDDLWILRTSVDGLSANDVTCIHVANDNTKWFGTSDSGVSRLDDWGTPALTGDDYWITFNSIRDGLSEGCVHVIATDDNGGVWFGTDSGLSYLDDGGTPDDTYDDHWRTFTSRDGLPAGAVLAIIPEPDGRIWVGTETTVCRFDTAGTPFDKTDDSYADLDIDGVVWGVSALEPGMTEDLWLATLSGLVHVY